MEHLQGGFVALHLRRPEVLQQAWQRLHGQIHVEEVVELEGLYPLVVQPLVDVQHLLDGRVVQAVDALQPLREWVEGARHLAIPGGGGLVGNGGQSQLLVAVGHGGVLEAPGQLRIQDGLLHRVGIEVDDLACQRPQHLPQGSVLLGEG